MGRASNRKWQKRAGRAVLWTAARTTLAKLDLQRYIGLFGHRREFQRAVRALAQEA
jgi:hypothetical protein